MDLMHRYVALRKKALKVPELHMYDLYAPMVEEFEMKVPFAQAKEIVKRACTIRRSIREGSLRWNGEWLD